jgi:hypothetical protein
MRAHASYEQPVALPSGEGWIQLPMYQDGWLHDPSLIDAEGTGYRPMCLSLWWSDGQEQVVYRWVVDGTLVALTTRRYEVQGRHPHKPLFAAIDRRASQGEAKPQWDMLATGETTPHHQETRDSVWRQPASGLAARIGRTHQLHTKLHSWITALPLDKV